MFLFSQLYSSVSVTSLACYPRSADWWLLFSLSLSRDKVVTSLIGGLFLLLHIYLSPFPNSFLSRTHTHFLSPPSSSPPLSLHPNTATHASTPHPYPPSPHASVSTMSLDVVLNSMLLHHHNCIMDRVIYNANVLWITQFTIHLWMVRQNGGFSATWRFGESQWCDMKVWRWSWSMAVVLGGGQVWWTWRFGGGVLLGRRRAKRDIRKCGGYPEKMRRLK